MKPTLLLAAALAISPVARAEETTIQHDNTAPMPSDHPNLGDGASTHEALPAGHPSTGQDTDAKALLDKVEAMRDQLSDKPKTIEIVVALGNLYYDNNRYLDAIDFYRQAIAQGGDLVATFKAARAAAGSIKPASLEKAGCDRATLKDSDVIVERAKKLQAEHDLAGALACATEAVKPVVMAHTRRGNAFYLAGNPTMAVTEHDRALELDDTDLESLFFKGAITFDAMGDDLAKLGHARDAWKRYLELSPESPRRNAVKEMLPQLEQAIALGGVSKLPRPPAIEGEEGASAPPLDPGAAQAVQGMELTPEVIAGFGPVLDQSLAQIAKGQMDAARTNLVRVFPFVMSQADKIPAPMRAKASALMSLYMASKGAPMAQSLQGQAVVADPASVDAVADALAAQGDSAHAKQLWNALVAGAPEYAEKAKVAAKVK